MRAARLGSDGSLRDAEGRVFDIDLPNVQQHQDIFPAKDKIGVPRFAAPPPRRVRTRPYMQGLGEISPTPGFNIRKILDLGVPRPADEFTLTKNVTGDRNTDLYLQRFIIPKPAIDPKSVYFLSSRPAGTGIVKLGKLHDNWTVTWEEKSEAEVKRDFLVPDANMGLMIRVSQNAYYPVFEGEKKPAPERCTAPYISQALAMAMSTVTADGFGEAEAQNSEEVAKRIKDFEASVIMGLQMAYQGVESAGAAFDCQLIGINAYCIFASTGIEVVKQLEKMANIIYRVRTAPTTADATALGSLHDAFVNKVDVWGLYLVRAQLWTALSMSTEISQGNKLTQAMENEVGIVLRQMRDEPEKFTVQSKMNPMLFDAVKQMLLKQLGENAAGAKRRFEIDQETKKVLGPDDMFLAAPYTYREMLRENAKEIAEYKKAKVKICDLAGVSGTSLTPANLAALSATRRRMPVEYDRFRIARRNALAATGVRAREQNRGTEFHRDALDWFRGTGPESFHRVVENMVDFVQKKLDIIEAAAAGMPLEAKKIAEMKTEAELRKNDRRLTDQQRQEARDLITSLTMVQSQGLPYWRDVIAKARTQRQQLVTDLAREGTFELALDKAFETVQDIAQTIKGTGALTRTEMLEFGLTIYRTFEVPRALVGTELIHLSDKFFGTAARETSLDNLKLAADSAIRKLIVEREKIDQTTEKARWEEKDKEIQNIRDVMKGLEEALGPEIDPVIKEHTAGMDVAMREMQTQREKGELDEKRAMGVALAKLREARGEAVDLDITKKQEAYAKTIEPALDALAREVGPEGQRDIARLKAVMREITGLRDALGRYKEKSVENVLEERKPEDVLKDAIKLNKLVAEAGGLQLKVNRLHTSIRWRAVLRAPIQSLYKFLMAPTLIGYRIFEGRFKENKLIYGSVMLITVVYFQTAWLSIPAFLGAPTPNLFANILGLTGDILAKLLGIPGIEVPWADPKGGSVGPLQDKEGQDAIDAIKKGAKTGMPDESKTGFLEWAGLALLIGAVVAPKTVIPAVTNVVKGAFDFVQSIVTPSPKRAGPGRPPMKRPGPGRPPAKRPGPGRPPKAK